MPINRQTVIPISLLGQHFAKMRDALQPTSLERTRPQALDLYKRMIRAVPDLIRIYKMPGESAVRKAEASVRSQFVVNRNMRDADLVAGLIEKGEQELEETVKFFKTPSHGIRSLNLRPDLELAKIKPKTFLADFINGKI